VRHTSFEPTQGMFIYNEAQAMSAAKKTL